MVDSEASNETGFLVDRLRFIFMGSRAVLDSTGKNFQEAPLTDKYIYIVYLDILIIYNIIYLFIYSVYNIYLYMSTRAEE